MDRLFPYPIPTDADPWTGLLVHPGNRIRLDAEGIAALIQHLRQVGFVHHGPQENRHDITIAVGTTDPDATITVKPGESIHWPIPDAGRSYNWIDGDTPSTLRLHDGYLTGHVNLIGVWKFTIVVGPSIHYDSLGYSGSPLEPGEWIPITQSRQQAPQVPEFNSMSSDELDQLIAAAQTARAQKGY